MPVDAVHREGITGVTAEQVDSARRAGYVVKLLAICERLIDDETGDEGVSARVYPALVPRSHPLAAVHGANNAVFVEAAAAGPLMFYGAGAGGVQTASAVLGDLVAIARRHVIGGPGIAESTHADLPVLDIGRITTRYAITLEVADEPGVLEPIAHVFAEHGVSVEQRAADRDAAGLPSAATLVIGTHEAKESALAETVAALAARAPSSHPSRPSSELKEQCERTHHPQGQLAPVARRHPRVRRPSRRHGCHARSSPSARAARRSCPRRRSPPAPAPTSG